LHRPIGARLCLLFQLVGGQKYDLLPVSAGGHFSSVEVAKI
jgi:hypothetical protein